MPVAQRYQNDNVKLDVAGASPIVGAVLEADQPVGDPLAIWTDSEGFDGADIIAAFVPVDDGTISVGEDIEAVALAATANHHQAPDFLLAATTAIHTPNENNLATPAAPQPSALRDFSASPAGPMPNPPGLERQKAIVANWLASLDTKSAPAKTRKAETATLQNLTIQLAEQACIIDEQATAIVHNRKLFERASATAKIGLWECDLDGERLTWSDGVYDIFELPRGSVIDRPQTLACYTEASKKTLQMLRSNAIKTCGDFTLDAEITTAQANQRWIRITATIDSVDGVATRIFGMKQDITEEKLLSDRTRYLAEFDVMTGLANRSQFQSRLAELGVAGIAKPIGALVLIDLDGFKQVNDTFGHAVGDDCIKAAAQRLKTVCAKAELVARIGGDEFAVLCDAHLELADIEHLASQIVRALNAPVDCSGQSVRLGASVGIAINAGCTPSDLFKRADMALYAAKAAGRNTFRTYSTGKA